MAKSAALGHTPAGAPPDPLAGGLGLLNGMMPVGGAAPAPTIPGPAGALLALVLPLGLFTWQAFRHYAWRVPPGVVLSNPVPPG